MGRFLKAKKEGEMTRLLTQDFEGYLILYVDAEGQLKTEPAATMRHAEDWLTTQFERSPNSFKTAWITRAIRLVASVPSYVSEVWDNGGRVYPPQEVAVAD